MTQALVKKLVSQVDKKTLSDALSLYSGRASIIFSGILSTLIYGIIFEKSQIAFISLFEMVVELFISFGFTWSTTGIVRFGRESYLKDKDLSYASSTRLYLILPILVFSILIVFIFRNSIINFIGTENHFILYFIVLNVLLMVFHEHITSLFNTAEKHKANVLFQIAHSFGKLFLLVLFYLHIFELKAELYIYFTVILLVLLVPLRVPYLEKNFLFPIRKIKKSDLSAYLKFVYPQIYGFAGMYLVNWMDLYFLRQYTSYEDLGSYQFLYSIFLKISSFAILLNILFFPKIMGWKKTNIQALSKYLTYMPIGIFGLCLLGCSLFLMGYPSIFNFIFGMKYEATYPAFNILVMTIPFYFISFLLIPVLNSYDRVSFIQLTSIASALVNLIIDYVYIERFGMVAAAVGTYLAYLLQYTFLLFGVYKLFKTNTLQILIFSGFLISVLYYFILI